jgi:hypothetical protein
MRSSGAVIGGPLCGRHLLGRAIEVKSDDLKVFHRLHPARGALTSARPL